MNTSCQQPFDDLGPLRATFGGRGWEFEAKWVTAASGPDRRLLLAHNDALELTISTWTPDDLAVQVQAAILRQDEDS